jgi:hypothetical protein
MTRYLLVVACIGSLVACSSKTPSPEAVPAAETTAPAVTKELVAKGVQPANIGSPHSVRAAPTEVPAELISNAPPGVNFGPGDPTADPVVTMLIADGAGGQVEITPEVRAACEKPVKKLVELGRKEAKVRKQEKFFEAKILPGMKNEFMVGCLSAMNREPVAMKAFAACLIGANDNPTVGACFQKYEAKLRPIFAPKGAQPPPIDPSVGAPPPAPGHAPTAPAPTR